jgi:hypothetical protein
MNRTQILGGLALASLLAVSPALAGPRRGSPTPERETTDDVEPGERLFSAIDATEAQEKALREIHADCAPRARVLRERTESVRVRMREAVDGGADLETLEPLRLELVAIADESSRLHLERATRIRDALSPEQWSRVRDLVSGQVGRSGR